MALPLIFKVDSHYIVIAKNKKFMYISVEAERFLRNMYDISDYIEPVKENYFSSGLLFTSIFLIKPFSSTIHVS